MNKNIITLHAYSENQSHKLEITLMDLMFYDMHKNLNTFSDLASSFTWIDGWQKLRSLEVIKKLV